jgi:hypothetical protein
VTGDQSLHHAALLVKGAELSLRKLLTDIEPLLRDHATTVHAAIDGITDPKVKDETWDRLDDESGGTNLAGNLLSLGRLPEWAEDFMSSRSRGEEAESAA